MKLTLFSNITSEDRSRAIDELIEHSYPSQSFYFMVLLSLAMASFGALIGSVPVLIGSMLIAPVLYPVISLAMGIVMSNTELIAKSVITLGKSTALGIGICTLISLFFIQQVDFKVSNIETLVHPSLIDAAIAIIAGTASSFAIVRKELNETLPGVAISVSMVPPLAVAGIGLGTLNWGVTSGALITFVVNVFGIIFASVTVFSIMNFYTKRSEVHYEIKKNEEKENAVVEVEND